MGSLQQPAPIAVRTSEASSHVAEELGLEQRIRYADAVDGDKRHVTSGAAPVDQLRGEVFAYATLPRQENLGV